MLYRGTGSGFERVDTPAINGSRWSLAATFLDLTGDGRPDIHVANDFNHDVLYANRGNGSFERIILPERTNRNGMSSEVADVSGDGRPDLFVTNIYYPDYFAETRATPLKARGNYLLVSRSGGSFAVQSSETAIHAGGWGWASVLADLDNDADQDLFHTTTRLTFRDPAVEAQLSEEQLEDLRSLSFYHRPAVWAYDRGDSFQKVSAAASGFGEHDGRGVARLDYDRDGDLDLAVATASEYRLYENRLDEPNAIQVRVLGPEGSPAGAYGATVRVNTTHTQTRWVHARTDFLSQDSRLVHVGIGNETTADVTVVWPDGTTRVFKDVTAGTRLVVTPEGIRAREDVSRDESE